MSSRFNPLEPFWFPLCPLSLLETHPIQPFTIMGHPLVVWKQPNGLIGAVADRCSHRSAKLSLGAISATGLLSCPYHGWQFDASGACRERPQCPDKTIPATCNIQAYACDVRYGYVWINLDSGSRASIPLFPESCDPGMRQIAGFHEIWNCSAFLVLENSFDHYHHCFVHAGLLEPLTVIPASIQGFRLDGDGGFQYSTVLRVSNSGQLGGALGHGDSVATVKRTVSWLFPFGVSLELAWSHGLWQRIIQYAIPVSENACLINRFYIRNDTESDVSADQLLGFERRLIDQDRDILEAIVEDHRSPTASLANLIDADGPIKLIRRKLAAALSREG